MIKYKIPKGIQEIIVKDNELFAYVRKLKQIGKDWIIEKTFIKLERIEEKECSQ